MKRSSSVAAYTCVALLALGSVAAQAALVGPAYPAPGGTTFSASGAASAGAIGGRNFNYSGFDGSAFSALYWGPSSASTPQAALDGSLDQLTFLSFSGTQAIWEGTTSWTNPDTSVTSAATVRLLITVTGLGANPWVSFSSVNGSDPSGVGAVVDNSTGLNFVANLQFLANTGSGFGAINLVEQPLSAACNPQCTKTSFAGAFYSAPPVPVPAAVWLFGSALGLMGVMRRKLTS